MWIYPINFGFLLYESVPVLSLDALFFGITSVAVINLLLFVLDPRKTFNAVMAGAAIWLRFWARGNSFPVVATLVLPLIITLGARLWKTRSLIEIANVTVVIALSILLCWYYYSISWQKILNYYLSTHAVLVTRHAWTLADATPYLRNVPGFFFIHEINATSTLWLTWGFHVFMLAALAYAFWKRSVVSEHVRAARIMSAAGAFIYFCTYLINIAIFTDPFLSLVNSLLIYAPMRIGMTFSIIACIMLLVTEKGIRIPNVVIPIAAVAILVYGNFLNYHRTLPFDPKRPTPQQVERFALSIDDTLGKGAVAILYFRHYNARILQYYRRKNDFTDLRQYLSTHNDDLWAQVGFTEERREKVLKELRNTFREADLIILPEFLDSYNLNYPFALYQFRDEVAKILNDPEMPQLWFVW